MILSKRRTVIEGTMKEEEGRKREERESRRQLARRECTMGLPSLPLCSPWPYPLRCAGSVEIRAGKRGRRMEEALITGMDYEYWSVIRIRVGGRIREREREETLQLATVMVLKL